MQKPLHISDIENTLYHLNYRWKLQTLALWSGQRAPFRPEKVYEGYDRFLSTETLEQIDQLTGSQGIDRIRLRHGIIDHCLQRALLPHENEMRAWVRGAAAHVHGKKIYIREIISWCQKQSTYETRQALQKEVAPLSKFLKPFALNYWNLLLETLGRDFGYPTYLAYITEKKGINYAWFRTFIQEVLEATDDLYFSAMDPWCRKSLGRPLGDLTRFDAIYLLSLAHLDALSPGIPLQELTSFFGMWGIDLARTPGLNLVLGTEEEKSGQAMCFVLQTPEEVYILMKPEGGWIDLETLWHELGHGLSSVFTSPELPLAQRELATSFGLSESFAFLNQNVTLGVPFLTGVLGLDLSSAVEVASAKAMKELSLFRRYGAKFLVEYDMFSGGDLSDGQHYAEVLQRYTGFYYQPEGHLMDLTPEMYSLDYLFGWMTESILNRHLEERLGSEWMFEAPAGPLLKKWWAQGNQEDLPGFLEQNALGPLHANALVKRWEQALNR